MGLERNTTINEHDNAERTRLLQENQAKEELYKKHGQELDAKRDISAPPESESANLSGVDCSDKSAKDKLDKNNQIKDDESKKVEGLKSKFDGDNYLQENLYDARATQETRDLVAKSVTPVREFNFGENVKAGEPSEAYTKEEINKLKSEREKIDAPNETTVMQKVIGVCSGFSKDHVNKDLDAYFNPKNREGKTVDAQVWGYVSKAEDSAPFTKTPEDCYNNARLDYDGTPYKKPEESVYVIRFTDGKNYEIPYNSEFGGENMDSQPCTGNGYIGNYEHLIPEYKVYPEKDNGAIITDGAIYRINPDSSEELVAEYNKKHHKFKLCKEEVGT